MHWHLSHHADRRACSLADRHYSRKTIGAPQMMPPGRKLVLLNGDATAVWGSSWPFAEYVKHAWAGAWMCTIFRNESTDLSSELIREAVAVTRWYWDIPTLGMITFVDDRKVRSANPGYCFKKAGFRFVGHNKGGQVALQLLPEDMPEAAMPMGIQLGLEVA